MVRLTTLAVALLLTFSACSSTPAASTPAATAPTAAAGQVIATLTDSTIQLSPAAVPNGLVTITVKNTGSVVHTLVVLKTNLSDDKIPVDPSNQAKADERGKVGGTTSELKPGQSTDIKLDLSSGKYVVICNELAHYQIGMHAPLTVN